MLFTVSFRSGRAGNFTQTQRNFTLGPSCQAVSSLCLVVWHELKLLLIAFNTCCFLSKIYSMSIDLTILFCVQLMENKHHMDLSARHLKIRGSSASPDMFLHKST